MLKINLIIKLTSFIKDICLYQIINYNNNQLINEILLFNYDLKPSDIFFNKNINIINKKTRVINLYEYEYNFKILLNNIIEKNNLYINSDFYTLFFDDLILELNNEFTINNFDLIYLMGREYFIDDKHLISDLYKKNSNIFVFNSNVKFDNKFNIIKNQFIKIKYLYNKSNNNYYSLKNCFKQSLLFDLFKNQYLIPELLLDNSANNGFANFIVKLKKYDLKMALNNLFKKNYLTNKSNIENNNNYQNLFLPYKINELTKIFEQNPIFINLINKPLVSIIMTVYNKEKYLDSCIKSMLRQTYSNIELILIDDCSTDKSKNILERYKNIPNIKIIYNSENKGCYYSRNIGIKNSQGEYIGFQDTDDYSISTRIEEQINFMLYNDLYMCGCNMIRSHILNIDYTNDNDNDILKAVYRNKCIEDENKCCKEYFGFPTLVIKKTLFDKWGLYLEEKKGMDMEYAERIIFKETNIIFGIKNENNENMDSWDFFNNYTYNDEKIFKNIYLKYEKLLVISPDMNESNLTNNIKSNDFLINRLWRKNYI